MSENSTRLSAIDASLDLLAYPQPRFEPNKFSPVAALNESPAAARAFAVETFRER